MHGTGLVPWPPAGFQPLEYDFRIGVGDERRVGVALDEPLGTWAALDPSPLVGVPIPDGVPGVGRGIPLQVDERAGAVVEADHGHELAPRDAARAASQVGLDGRGEIAQLQYAFGHRLSFANGAGRDPPEPVPDGGPAAGPIALVDVLRHARETLGARHHAVKLIHRLEDGAEQHLGDRIGLRDRLVDELDIAAPALVLLEHERREAAARETRGVEEVQRGPLADRRADLGQQGLEAGPVLGGARVHCVRELTDEALSLRLRQLAQLPELRRDGHVVPVFARTRVSGCV